MPCWTKILWCKVYYLKDCEIQISSSLISVVKRWPTRVSEWNQRADTQEAYKEAQLVSWPENSLLSKFESLTKASHWLVVVGQTISRIKLGTLLSIEPQNRIRGTCVFVFFFLPTLTVVFYLPHHTFNGFSFLLISRHSIYIIILKYNHAISFNHWHWNLCQFHEPYSDLENKVLNFYSLL